MESKVDGTLSDTPGAIDDRPHSASPIMQTPDIGRNAQHPVATRLPP